MAWSKEGGDRLCGFVSALDVAIQLTRREPLTALRQKLGRSYQQ
jgi:hypothetical protein